MERVNCGCWHRVLPGYVNIDFNPAARECEGGEYIVVHDLTEGIPFIDASLAEVRGDQFLEHLELPQIRDFLDECARVLCVGGEVRFTFPDIRLAIGGRQVLLVQEQGLGIEGVPDQLVYLNLLTHEWGHRSILSLEALTPMVAERFTILHAATYGVDGLIIARKE